MTRTPGYSGTPLARKLGVKEGHVVSVLDEPEGFREWLRPIPEGVRLRSSIGRAPDIVVVFAADRDAVHHQEPESALGGPDYFPLK